MRHSLRLVVADSTLRNYNPFELANNDICILPRTCFQVACTIAMASYNDDDGICNELEVPGCQVVWACNYNELATDPPPPMSPAFIRRTMS